MRQELIPVSLIDSFTATIVVNIIVGGYPSAMWQKYLTFILKWNWDQFKFQLQQMVWYFRTAWLMLTSISLDVCLATSCSSSAIFCDISASHSDPCRRESKLSVPDLRDIDNLGRGAAPSGSLLKWIICEIKFEIYENRCTTRSAQSIFDTEGSGKH